MRSLGSQGTARVRQVGRRDGTAAALGPSTASGPEPDCEIEARTGRAAVPPEIRGRFVITTASSRTTYVSPAGARRRVEGLFQGFAGIATGNGRGERRHARLEGRGSTRECFLRLRGEVGEDLLQGSLWKSNGTDRFSTAPDPGIGLRLGRCRACEGVIVRSLADDLGARGRRGRTSGRAARLKLSQDRRVKRPSASSGTIVSLLTPAAFEFVRIERDLDPGHRVEEARDVFKLGAPDVELDLTVERAGELPVEGVGGS